MASLPTSATAQPDGVMRLRANIRSVASDRTNLALVAVFLLASAFYLWRADFSVPLDLHGSQTSPYNQLADAFLHFHLWVVRVPAALLRLGPNSLELHRVLGYRYPDYVLYGNYIYLTWGPAPVLVLLVPLHLLGFEPSGSVIIIPFAIVGLGFALAALRVILRQIGKVPQWACIIAALTLAFASVVPYLLRAPEVYREAIAGGYCFATGGIWLAVSAIVERRASLIRLLLMSLCFGLAAASRPTLGLTALTLLPVYRSLRSIRPRRRLLVTLVAPVAICLLLLAAYNQARFGDPLQYGTPYQLNEGGVYGRLSYVPPGVWSYLMTPPRLTVLFPFLSAIPPEISYPLSLPAHYLPVSEETAGLLPMAPIVIFLAALPWVWRRRPALLGPLALPLLLMSIVGMAILVFVSYEFFAATERYEVDFTTMFLLGALAVWLALLTHAQGRGRWLVRTGGGLLAAWSCLAGVAIGSQELENHPDAWRTLVDIGSPVSTAMASVVGHPVLAEVYAPIDLPSDPSPSYDSIGTGVTGFLLGAGEQADLTIVSPNSRYVALVGNVFAGPALKAGAPVQALIRGPGHTRHSFQLPAEGAEVRIWVHVNRGVNQLVLSPIVAAGSEANPSTAESEPRSLMAITNLRLASS
jgi:hypothetical protein